MNKILVIDEMTNGKWVSKQWYELFENVIGHCFNLKTAKEFAKEYYESSVKNPQIEAIKCKYLNTTFIIRD